MRLLVRMPNWLGDIVMAIWAVDAALSRLDQPTLEVICRPQFRELFSLWPVVKAVHTTGSSRGLTGVLRPSPELVALSKENFDCVALLTNSLGSAVELRSAGIHGLCGYKTDGRSLLLSRSLPRPGWEKQRHIFFYYLDLLQMCTGTRGELPSELPLVPPLLKLPQISANSLAIAGISDRIDGGYAVLATGAAFGPAKQWTPEKYAEVVRAVHRASGLPFLLVGNRSDSEFAKEVSAQCGNRCLDITGQTTLLEAVALFAGSLGFIGNDSGLMHLAAMTGVPTLGIFLSTDTERTSPLGPHVACVTADVPCRPCFRRECDRGYHCRKAVDPDTVASRFLALMCL